MGITIAGTGCSLIDILYSDVDFGAESIAKYMSRKTGDGGLSPGRLVFTEELEAFAGTSFNVILKDVVGDRKPSSTNLGGPAIVALINAAQLLQGNDVAVRFHAARGDDQTGQEIRRILQKTPVNTDNYDVVSGYSPYTTVFSDPTYDDGHGERMFVNNIGAAWKLMPADLGDNFFEADILCYGATALVPNIHDGLTELLQKGRDLGRLNVVSTVYDFRNEQKNPGAPWPVGRSDESFPCIDLFISDREEAVKITGEDSVETALASLKDKGVKTIAITQGADAVHLFADGSVCRKLDHMSLPVSEAVVKALRSTDRPDGDTTGCGDNFAGGVLASFASQMLKAGRGNVDLVEACAWGICSGGFACFYHGGTYVEAEPGMKLREVSAYFDKYREQVRSIRDIPAPTLR